jgi:hypothetical protein
MPKTFLGWIIWIAAAAILSGGFYLALSRRNMILSAAIGIAFIILTVVDQVRWQKGNRRNPDTLN